MQAVTQVRKVDGRTVQEVRHLLGRPIRYSIRVVLPRGPQAGPYEVRR